MELRVYWQILRRRWLLVLIPAATVMLIALATYRQPPPAYNVGVRFEVGQIPAANAMKVSVGSKLKAAAKASG